MKNKYTVEIKFVVAGAFDVEAADEGEALTKARELAEMAPMSSFFVTEEENARILNIRPLGDGNRDDFNEDNG